MEASITVNRCMWRACARPTYRTHVNTGKSTSFSRSKQYRVKQAPSRCLSSTSRSRQDTPPQLRPVSQTDTKDGVVVDTPSRNPSADQIPKPDPNKRIDLSSLSEISSPSVENRASPRASSRPAGTASARLDALFNRPSRGSSSSSTNSPESPFQKAIRQSNALDNNSFRFSSYPSPETDTLKIRALLEGIEDTRPDGLLQTSEADAKMPLRLKPTLGRTQTVDTNRSIDLTRAFRMLEVKCTANNVKRDQIRQRFHVRRGQRKKLDRSLRWRAAFKAGFLEECARVRRMKNQGW